ncbi:MAG TPA: thioredoxin domain-containing protein [Nitrospiraceae bacterium]|jgi:protein-disulfide isomerase|nr:thioredoxin domain-containing protein [Nitrospiraceae bacterium]
MMGTRWFYAVVGALLLALVQLAEAGGGAVADDGRIRGRADAPITLIEYSDFTCGYCGKFFRETWPRLQAKYIETGKVRFVYRDYPRSDQGTGVEAAVAARCAGSQGRYWQMHDRLFSERGRLDSGSFKSYAKVIGLDEMSFAKCFDEREYLESIFRDRQEANRWGFHGTPGFILIRTVGGPTEKEPAVAIPGAVPFEDFAEEIDRMLATTPRSQGEITEPQGSTAVAQSSQFIIY